MTQQTGQRQAEDADASRSDSGWWKITVGGGGPLVILTFDGDCGQAYLSSEMARAIGKELITAANASDFASSTSTTFEHHG